MIIRVSTLQLVYVYPPTGFPDRPWLEHPDEDAFARSARSVCELYSESVRRAAIRARHSELHVACRHDPGRDGVLVTVHPEVTEGYELAVALLPDGIAALPAAARAGLVLDVVHGAAARLGQERGWDQAALEAAREHVLAARLRYTWDSPAKSSPDRKHTAQARFALHDDGYGRVVLEVRRRSDGVLVAGSAPAQAFSTAAGFARSAQTIRWKGSRTVELVPYAGLSAGVGRTTFWRDNHGLLTVDLDDPHGPVELPLAEHHVVPPGAPPVTVQTPDETGPRIVVIGGGPVTDDLPAAYLDTLRGLLEQLAEPQWQAWWAGTDAQALEISYFFTAAETGPTARRVKQTLRTVIRRPWRTFAALDAPDATAREDVEAMLHLVRRRTGLGPPPPLRQG